MSSHLKYILCCNSWLWVHCATTKSYWLLNNTTLLPIRSYNVSSLIHRIHNSSHCGKELASDQSDASETYTMGGCLENAIYEISLCSSFFPSLASLTGLALLLSSQFFLAIISIMIKACSLITPLQCFLARFV